MNNPPRYLWAGAISIVAAIGVFCVLSNREKPESSPATTSPVAPQSAPEISAQHDLVNKEQAVTTFPRNKAIPVVDAAYSVAKAQVQALQATALRPGPSYDGPTGKWDSVYLDPLTPEQLSKAFTIVTDAGKSFPPESLEAKEYRRKADALFSKLQRRPATLVRRKFGNDGKPTYQAVDLGPKTTIRATENGGISVEGPNTVHINREDDYTPLFEKLAQTAK